MIDGEYKLGASSLRVKLPVHPRLANRPSLHCDSSTPVHVVDRHAWMRARLRRRHTCLPRRRRRIELQSPVVQPVVAQRALPRPAVILAPVDHPVRAARHAIHRTRCKYPAAPPPSRTPCGTTRPSDTHPDTPHACSACTHRCSSASESPGGSRRQRHPPAARTPAFVSRSEAIEAVTMGSHADWLAHSDHSPMTVDLRV